MPARWLGVSSRSGATLPGGCSFSRTVLERDFEMTSRTRTTGFVLALALAAALFVGSFVGAMSGGEETDSAPG
jgi:hypothetical protein